MYAAMLYAALMLVSVLIGHYDRQFKEVESFSFAALVSGSDGTVSWRASPFIVSGAMDDGGSFGE